MIIMDKGRVEALDLVEKDGILAVPVDRGYRYVGDVTQEPVVIDGMNVKRWYATTLVDSHIGPFTDRRKALVALLEWNHLRQAVVSETTTPLF